MKIANVIKEMETSNLKVQKNNTVKDLKHSNTKVSDAQLDKFVLKADLRQENITPGRIESVILINRFNVS